MKDRVDDTIEDISKYKVEDNGSQENGSQDNRSQETRLTWISNGWIFKINSLPNISEITFKWNNIVNCLFWY